MNFNRIIIFALLFIPNIGLQARVGGWRTWLPQLQRSLGFQPAIDKDLLVAVSSGNTYKVDLLLRQGAYVNTREETPLHSTSVLQMAAVDGYQAIVARLLDAKVRVDDKDVGGSTALHNAAERGRALIVQQLIEAGANVNSVDVSNNTPLHMAAHRGYKEVVELLLHAGANPNIPNEWGRTPLHKAIQGGYTDIVTILLAAGANRELCDKYIPSFHRYITDAASWGNIHRVQEYLDAGGDLNADELVSYAAYTGRLAIVDMLLKRGANANGGEEAPLFSAIRGNRPEVVKRLIDAGADVNVGRGYKRTPLHDAAEYGLITIAQQLLDAGANPLAKDEKSQMPADIAKEHDNQEMFNLLQRYNSATI